MSSAENAANYGIAQIGADVAYTAGARGANVKVAVIDSGIALGHPEFAGRIDRQNSIDIVTGRTDTLEDRSGHGSHIAGIIAANVDGNGVRGVAPQAQLLAIRADLRDDSVCSNPGCGYFDRDVAAALNHARQNGAQIVNLSIGKDTPISNEYRRALEQAVASGMLVVVAAGNQSNDRPLYPGLLAAEPALRDGILVVGAVNANGQIYALTNRAGSTVASYLVAPGVNILSTYRDGGYQRLTGTSMAAPHVSGAAAVLKSAFPSLSMQQVSQILRSTADDLGAPGIDQVFGHGLVNLERALQPVGRQQLAAGEDLDGRRHAVDSTSLALGAAFGDAFDGHAGLAQTMVLDAFDRPYRADLGQLVHRPRGAMELDRLLIDADRYHALPLQGLAALGIDARLELSEQRNRPVAGSAAAARLGGADDGEQRFERLSLDAVDTPLGQVSVGIGFVPSSVAAGGDLRAARGLFLDGAALLTPGDDLVDRGTGASLRFDTSDSTTWQVGVLDSSGLTSSRNNGIGRPGRLVSLGVEQRLSEQLALGLSHTYLDESGGALGSAAKGGFALADGATTHLGQARLAYRPAANVEVFGQATLALTRLGGGDGLLQDWSDIRSDAYAVGIVAADIASAGDRLGVVVGQPLRVSSASAVLDRPVSRTLEGAVERSRDRVDMAPSGRELRLQLAYERRLGIDQALGTWLLLQHEPGHDARAGRELGIGLRYTGRF